MFFSQHIDSNSVTSALCRTFSKNGGGKSPKIGHLDDNICLFFRPSAIKVPVLIQSTVVTCSKLLFKLSWIKEFHKRSTFLNFKVLVFTSKMLLKYKKEALYLLLFNFVKLCHFISLFAIFFLSFHKYIVPLFAAPKWFVPLFSMIFFNLLSSFSPI